MRQGLVSNGAGVVTQQPALQRLPIISLAVRCYHRIPHHILQDKTASLSVPNIRSIYGNRSRTVKSQLNLNYQDQNKFYTENLQQSKVASNKPVQESLHCLISAPKEAVRC